MLAVARSGHRRPHPAVGNLVWPPTKQIRLRGSHTLPAAIESGHTAKCHAIFFVVWPPQARSALPPTRSSQKIARSSPRRPNLADGCQIRPHNKKINKQNFYGCSTTEVSRPRGGGTVGSRGSREKGSPGRAAAMTGRGHPLLGSVEDGTGRRRSQAMGQQGRGGGRRRHGRGGGRWPR